MVVLQSNGDTTIGFTMHAVMQGTKKYIKNGSVLIRRSPIGLDHRSTNYFLINLTLFKMETLRTLNDSVSSLKKSPFFFKTLEV